MEGGFWVSIRDPLFGLSKYDPRLASVDFPPLVGELKGLVIFANNEGASEGIGCLFVAAVKVDCIIS